MTAKRGNSDSKWTDVDDAPVLDDGFFDEGTWRVGDNVVSKHDGRQEVARRGRGRPAGTEAKVSTTIRLDRDIIKAFRAGGPGWQTRMNTALREWLREHDRA